MDITSFRKRKRTGLRLRILALFLILMLSLSGCDPFVGKYPCDSEATWVCHDPKIVLEYTYVGGHLYRKEVIEYNGEEIFIEAGYRGGYFYALPRNSNYYSDRLLTGEWKYVDGNLVIEVEEDYLFGWRYPELVFERVK